MFILLVFRLTYVFLIHAPFLYRCRHAEAPSCILWARCTRWTTKDLGVFCRNRLMHIVSRPLLKGYVRDS